MQMEASPGVEALSPGGRAPVSVGDEVRRYLAEFPASLVVEAGEVLFDLREANYEVSDEGRSPMLHLWSAERNVVRRVVGAVRKGETLRVETTRLGHRQPVVLEIRRVEGDAFVVGERERGRDRFAEVLQRLLQREFPGFAVEGARAALDLQHSFGPAYVRGMQRQGQQVWAFVGVAAGESAATVEGILTIGVLWMAHLRTRFVGERVVQGVRLVVPEGQAQVTQARLAWMDRRVAQYELYELESGSGRLRRCDPDDRGNLRTELMHALDDEAALVGDGRFSDGLPRLLSLLDEPAGGWSRGTRLRDQLLAMGVEARLRSEAELALLRHGLEFARLRLVYGPQGLRRTAEVLVGAGGREVVLGEANAGEMRALVAELFARRAATTAGRSGGAERDVLFRAQPERWLESRLRAEVGVLDDALAEWPVYAQVGAVAGASDRGMIDLLAHTKTGRLAVIEVKVDEDLHLPLQGLDYWIRVHDHHRASRDAATGLGDLQRKGYFARERLSGERPLLFLVAPALRIHPSTEVVLRHLHPDVEWRLVALDERWRGQLRAVWRRRSGERRLEVEL